MNIPSHVEAYIHASESGVPGEYYFNTWGMDMSSCGYIPVARVEIPMPTITIDQIKARHLVLLRLKKEEVYAEAAKKAADLDEQIGRLEAIGYTPATHVAEPEIPL